jgi:type III secretory pathway lipoprotein EscJ
MADVVRLTVVASQGEADVICALLRSAEINCADRATDMFAERGGGFRGWREVLVEETDLAAARDLLASGRG